MCGIPSVLHHTCTGICQVAVFIGSQEKTGTGSGLSQQRVVAHLPACLPAKVLQGHIPLLYLPALSLGLFEGTGHC